MSQHGDSLLLGVPGRRSRHDTSPDSPAQIGWSRFLSPDTRATPSSSPFTLSGRSTRRWKALGCAGFWRSRRGDSNPGPPPYHGGALPAELRRRAACNATAAGPDEQTGSTPRDDLGVRLCPAPFVHHGSRSARADPGTSSHQPAASWASLTRPTHTSRPTTTPPSRNSTASAVCRSVRSAVIGVEGAGPTRARIGRTPPTTLALTRQDANRSRMICRVYPSSCGY